MAGDATHDWYCNGNGNRGKEIKERKRRPVNIPAQL